MDRAEAMRRIEKAGEYSEQAVKEAVAEVLRGEHGEEARALLFGICQRLGLTG